MAQIDFYGLKTNEIIDKLGYNLARLKSCISTTDYFVKEEKVSNARKGLMECVEIMAIVHTYLNALEDGINA